MSEDFKAGYKKGWNDSLKVFAKEIRLFLRVSLGQEKNPVWHKKEKGRTL